jgi:hypothetical protein
MLVLGHVTLGMRGQVRLKVREACERSWGSVWITGQMTVRMRGQDGLTERGEDER